MGDYQNETWPERLHLSDMHAAEIVNWMQDFDAPEAGYADSRGHYTREDLHTAALAERDALRAEVERLRDALAEWSEARKHVVAYNDESWSRLSAAESALARAALGKVET